MMSLHHNTSYICLTEHCNLLMLLPYLLALRSAFLESVILYQQLWETPCSAPSK